MDKIAKGEAPRPSLPKRDREEASPPPSPPREKSRPKIALVIDDLGRNSHISRGLVDLGFPVTLSILPLLPYAKSLAAEASLKGKEVILHLPMEPQGYPKVNPGEGALLLEMDEETLLRRLARDIESVPKIKGVSNHMGSRFMEDSEKLRIIFSDLKRRGLFFLDSRTTPLTAGLQTAARVGLQARERTLFVDHLLQEDAIRKNLDHLIQSSLSTGMAIGIGHPHPMTIKLIQEMAPRMKEKGVEIVPLSVLIAHEPRSPGASGPLNSAQR